MNINNEMNQLGQMGSTGYAGSDQVVDQLVTRAKRRRSARRSAAAVVGAASAMVLGLVGAQVVAVIQDNDAGRNDRNAIERSLGEDFSNSKYSKDNNGKTDTDLDSIFKKLEAAAKTETKKPSKSTHTKKKSTTTTTTKKSACTDDTTSYDYKYYDCSKGKWKKYATSYKDTYGDKSWKNCATDGGVEHASQHVYFDCDKMDWKTDPGYFFFFDDHIYKCETWKNVATGTVYYGNYSSQYDKVIFCDSATSTSYSYYKHLYGYATWSAVTGKPYKYQCVGNSPDENGAPWKYDCATEERTMTDPTNYKKFTYSDFFDGCDKFDYRNKNSDFTYDDRTFHWNGSAWEEVAA